MNNPLHAKHYADHAVVARGAEIVEHVLIARGTRRTRIRCAELARRILPGQFVMVRLTHCDDPLIGRPMAMYDVWREEGRPAGVDVVYVVKGKLTTALDSCRPGQLLDVWGPLGNGFPPRQDQRLILVAGGIGQTPFLALGKQRLGAASYGGASESAGRAERVTLCYGARTADLLAGVDDFQAAGLEVRISTDDGTAGRHGMVTDELSDVLAEAGSRGPSARVICCGPEPMMEAVTRVCQQNGVSCEVSLETPMACGIGICFSCVAKVKQPDGAWDYKRTCVDGPVFDAASIEWH